MGLSVAINQGTQPLAWLVGQCSSTTSRLPLFSEKVPSGQLDIKLRQLSEDESTSAQDIDLFDVVGR